MSIGYGITPFDANVLADDGKKSKKLVEYAIKLVEKYNIIILFWNLSLLIFLNGIKDMSINKTLAYSI